MPKPAAGQEAPLVGAGFVRCPCGCLVLRDARTGETSVLPAKAGSPQKGVSVAGRTPRWAG